MTGKDLNPGLQSGYSNNAQNLTGKSGYDGQKGTRGN